ncbi:MAG TPA: CbtA family protein, partial [Nitrosopumilaceae archaeon]|nr:CbtA family protein [Nitrosopumilaceae archaeon]
ISGFGAVAFYQMYKRLQKGKKIASFIGYAVFISIVFALMPPNPDEITAPMDLVNGFRAMSVIAVSVFWIALGIILGLFWERLQPHFSLQKEHKSVSY